MLGIASRKTLLILCPLTICLSYQIYPIRYRHFTDEETESQKAFLLSPMSQSSSKRKAEYKLRSP